MTQNNKTCLPLRICLFGFIGSHWSQRSCYPLNWERYLQQWSTEEAHKAVWMTIAELWIVIFRPWSLLLTCSFGLFNKTKPLCIYLLPVDTRLHGGGFWCLVYSGGWARTPNGGAAFCRIPSGVHSTIQTPVFSISCLSTCPISWWSSCYTTMLVCG